MKKKIYYCVLAHLANEGGSVMMKTKFSIPVPSYYPGSCGLFFVTYVSKKVYDSLNLNEI